MKVGITWDDVRVRKYILGVYDFNTRQIEVSDDIVPVLQAVQELQEAAQRVLSSIYNSNGKYVAPEDLEKLACLTVKTAAESRTRAAKSEKQRKLQDSEAPSNSESQTA